MEQQSANKVKRAVRIGGLVLGLAIMVAFTVLGARWVLSLQDPERLAHFQSLLEQLGIGGWFVLLAIQYIQIVVAFIPGGPIQVVAGAMYGPLGGLLVCLTGTILATMTVFGLIKKYGKRALSLFVDEKDVMRYKFLNDARRLETLVLVLFFVPGTPKDALTYLFALTPIAMPRFMLLSTAARVPAMLTSVLAGDAIMEGQWLKALLLFIGITVISACGLLLHRKILHLQGKDKQ